MPATVEQEARYLSKSESLKDGRQRFSEIASRASELMVEKESEFWSQFVDAYAAEQQGAPHGSERHTLHARLLEDVKRFVDGKDQA